MKLQVKQGTEVYQIDVTEEMAKEHSLLELLRMNQIMAKADCGGKGRCGKCTVTFEKGVTPPTEADYKRFGEQQVAAGVRLSCLSYLTEDASIILADTKEEEMKVQSTFVTNQQSIQREDADDTDDVFGIAIDIGTTTIAISLVNLDKANVVDTHTTMNHQRQWGTDVISRIQADSEGQGEALCASIRKDLAEGIEALLKKCGVLPERIEKIIIAGNTTMGHLVMGYSCKTLGYAPFTPVDISVITASVEELFGLKGYHAPIILLPGISTFVGADIVAGMYATGMHQDEKVSLLLDLGTNGEMAIGNKDRFLVTSTAAGPAFEGGNISCGVASVPGAICHVAIEGETIEIKTIDDKPPVGLCGTGVLETVYELKEAEWIDESGVLEDDYFEDGVRLGNTEDGKEICFIQKDIREIQLAKSAVRAGLECLIHEFGVTYEDISNVYIAGGFGYKMDYEKAVGIGMLSEELLPKMKAVGNTSLGGAIGALLEDSAIEQMKEIVNQSKEVELASSKEFSQYYMDYMFFE